MTRRDTTMINSSMENVTKMYLQGLHARARNQACSDRFAKEIIKQKEAAQLNSAACIGYPFVARHVEARVFNDISQSKFIRKQIHMGAKQLLLR